MFLFNAYLVLVGVVSVSAAISWVRLPITCEYKSVRYNGGIARALLIFAMHYVRLV